METGTIVGLCIFVGVPAFVIAGFWIQAIRDRNKLEKAFSLLTAGFNSDVAIDKDDILLIYIKMAPADFGSFTHFLEEYLLYLRNGHSDEVRDFSSVNLTLKKIIGILNASVPYGGIDENKRRVMLSIEDAVQEEASKKSVKKYLEDLTGFIRSTERSLKRAKNMNNWSIPLAAVSLFFSILSLFVGSRLSNRDLDRLDQHISTTIYQRIDSLYTVEKELQLDQPQKGE